MKFFYLAVLSLGLAFLAGCATPSRPVADSIQGTWKGTEVRQGDAFTSWLLLSGSDFEFKSADARESYRGTFTVNETTNPKQLILVINQSSIPDFAGKTVNAVFEFTPGNEGHDSLIITGYEPGNSQMPTSIGDRRGRQIVFTRD